MHEELELILSCVPTILGILTEPSPLLVNYLHRKRRRSSSRPDLMAAVLSEMNREDDDNNNNNNNDDEEDEVSGRSASPGSKRKKFINYCDSSIESELPNVDFEVNFKMSKNTVQEIIDLMERAHLKPVQRGRPIMPVKKMVLLSLWLLTRKEGFRNVADRFSIGKGHAHRAFEIFCVTMHSVSHEYIKWPDREEAKTIVNGFQEMSSILNVIGIIGIIHVAIPKPAIQDEIYHNSNGYYSVLLQAICNHKNEFINVLAGPAGSTCEADVWITSPLYEKVVESPGDVFPDDCHLLGNSAYPLSPHILPPYEDRHRLTPERAIFNSAHKIAHIRIKETFKLLISRFQRLTFLNMTRMDLLPKVIVAGCVLHNLCKMRNENDVETEDKNIMDSLSEVNYFAENEEMNEISKRDEIANFLVSNVTL